MPPQTFIFFGRAGSGKGTQANLIIEDLKGRYPEQECIYIETGQKLREFVSHEGFSEKLTKKVLEEGKLMPSFVPIWLWTHVFVKDFNGNQNIILDGICRNAYEAPVLDTALKFYKLKPVNIIVINTSDEWAIQKAIGRGRHDDEILKIKKRLEWFDKEVVTAIKFFRDDPYYNVMDINGEQTIDQVHQEIVKKLGW